MKNYLYLVLTFMACTSFCYPLFPVKGIIRHDILIEEYRKIGGQSSFACVGRYSRSEQEKDFAAGVLVASNWVLTAAHFVEDSSVWYFDSTYYHTKKIIRHPLLEQLSENRPAQWDGVDLALIQLDRDVAGVQPATLYGGEAELGMIISKVGYGFIGDGRIGMKSPRVQERLGGHNTIDQVGGRINEIQLGPNVLLADFDDPISDTLNQIGSSIPLPLEIGGSKGDSGGGVFVCEGKSCQLIGIVSGALNRRIMYGSIMAFARISTAKKWIEQVISENEGQKK